MPAITPSDSPVRNPVNRKSILRRTTHALRQAARHTRSPGKRGSRQKQIGFCFLFLFIFVVVVVVVVVV